MVYILLPQGFEEIEALVPADLLRRAGIPVKLVALDQLAVTGGQGVTVQADLLLSQARAEDAELIFLPGGRLGVDNLKQSGAARDFILEGVRQGRQIAAICAAPTWLAQLDLLNGRKAVCYPGLEGEMGAAVLEPEKTVVEDGPFLTARAAGSAYDLALAIIARLKNERKAQEVRDAIYYSSNIESAESAAAH